MSLVGKRNINIDSILSQIAAREDISDIHIAADEYISFRKNGEIVKYTKIDPLTSEDVEIMLKQLLK
jgi:Tfp pilus assembly pilus retraction ATPase PilT